MALPSTSLSPDQVNKADSSSKTPDNLFDSISLAPLLYFQTPVDPKTLDTIYGWRERRRLIPSNSAHLLRDYARARQGKSILLDHVDPYRHNLPEDALTRIRLLENRLSTDLTKCNGDSTNVFAGTLNIKPEDTLEEKLSKASKVQKIRKDLRLEKWLPLSQIANFSSVIKASNRADYFNDDYFKLFCDFFEANDEMHDLLQVQNDTREKKLDHLIGHQNEDLAVSIRELISNSIDASSNLESPEVEVEVEVGAGYYSVADQGTGMDKNTIIKYLLIPAISSKDESSTIGRFGVGFFSSLAHLKTNKDAVVVETSDGENSYTIKFQKRPEYHDQVSFTISRNSEIKSKGTKVTVKSENLKIDHLKEVVEKSFRHSSKAGVNITDSRNGEKNKINFTDDKFHKYKCKTGIVGVKLYDSKDSNSEINILVDGIFVQKIGITTNTSKGKNLVIDLPLKCSLPESRDRVAFDEVLLDALNTITEQSLADLEISFEEKLVLLEYLNQYYSKLEDPAIKKSFELMDNLKKAVATNLDFSGKTIIPNIYKDLFDKFEVKNPIYLPIQFYPIFDFTNVPGITKCSTFDYTGADLPTQILLVDFKNNDSAIIKANGTFFLNRRVYEEHKSSPEILNAYFSNLDHSRSKVTGEKFYGRFHPINNENNSTNNLSTLIEPNDFLSQYIDDAKQREKNLKYSPRAVECFIDKFLKPNAKGILNNQYLVDLILKRIVYKSDTKDLWNSFNDDSSNLVLQTVDLNTPEANLDDKNKERINFIKNIEANSTHYFRFINSPGIQSITRCLNAQSDDNKATALLQPHAYFRGPVKEGQDKALAFLESFMDSFKNFTIRKNEILSEFVLENYDSISPMRSLQLVAAMGLIATSLNLSDENFKKTLRLIFNIDFLPMNAKDTNSFLFNTDLFNDSILNYIFNKTESLATQYQAQFFRLINIFIDKKNGKLDRQQVLFIKKVLLPVFLNALKDKPLDDCKNILAVIESNKQSVNYWLKDREKKSLELKSDSPFKAEAAGILENIFKTRNDSTEINLINEYDLSQEQNFTHSFNLANLFLAKQLRWSDFEEKTDGSIENFANLINLVNNTTENKDLEEADRTIRHLINTQVVNDPWVWLREITQNSFDAIVGNKMSGKVNIDVRSFVNQKDDNKQLIVSFADPVGMSLFEVFNYLLLPNETTKENNAELIGKYGQGFFTIFNGAKEIRIKTSIGNGTVVYLKLTPLNIAGRELENNERIANIKVDIELKQENYKGTIINKIIDTEVPELYERTLERELRDKVGSLKAIKKTVNLPAPEHIQFYTVANSTPLVKPKEALSSKSTESELMSDPKSSSDASVPNNLDINIVYTQESQDKVSLINKTNYPEETKNIEGLGNLSLRFDHKGVLTKNGLKIKDINETDKPLWFHNFSSELKDLLPKLSIDLPAKVELTRSREAVVDYHEQINKLRPHINDLLVHLILKLFNTQKINVADLLNYDFFERYSRRNISKLIKHDAEELSKSSNNKIDYQPYIDNPNLLIDLLRNIKVIDYKDKKVSLRDLSVLFNQNRTLIDISQLPERISEAIARERAFLNMIAEGKSTIRQQKGRRGHDKSRDSEIFGLTDSETFSIAGLNPAIRSDHPAYVKFDQIREFILSHLGLGSLVHRGYHFSYDGSAADAFQGSPQNGIIRYNLRAWEKPISNLSRQDLFSHTLQKMIEVETHERVHQLEQSGSETHNFSFFAMQRKILEKMLLSGPLNQEIIYSGLDLDELKMKEVMPSEHFCKLVLGEEE